MTLQRERVKSSVIESLGYDTERHTLEVEFRTGRIYQYFMVPPDLHRRLMNAKSIGGFFNRRLRDVYRCDEVTKGRIG